MAKIIPLRVHHVRLRIGSLFVQASGATAARPNPPSTRSPRLLPFKGQCEKPETGRPLRRRRRVALRFGASKSAAPTRSLVHVTPQMMNHFEFTPALRQQPVS
jgi:hypothetical protein